MSSLEPSPPTLLISPAAFAILDVLLRVPFEELQLRQKEFADSNNLSRSRLSKIMTALDVDNLQAFHRTVTTISRKWWKSAMHYPRTRQRMTPFFDTAQYYTSDRSNAELLDEMLHRYPLEALPGPAELPKELRLIIEPTVHLWLAPQIFAECKRSYRLVPTRSIEENALLIAVPKRDFLKESLISRAQQFGLPSLSAKFDSANIPRMIWDLGFGDSRLQDAQDALIERLLRGKS